MILTLYALLAVQTAKTALLAHNRFCRSYAEAKAKAQAEGRWP